MSSMESIPSIWERTNASLESIGAVERSLLPFASRGTCLAEIATLPKSPTSSSRRDGRRERFGFVFSSDGGGAVDIWRRSAACDGVTFGGSGDGQMTAGGKTDFRARMGIV